jgi:hypothetical protein
MGKIREDVEALAKALCRNYESGVGSQKGWTPAAIRSSMDENWRDFIPQAQKLADETYGHLLEVCQQAYLKHVMGVDEIGWNELGDNLNSALVSVMGESEYNKWMDKIQLEKTKEKYEQDRK